MTAHNGSRPTKDLTLSRVGRTVRHPEHVVEEAVLLVPHARRGVADAIGGGGDPT